MKQLLYLYLYLYIFIINIIDTAFYICLSINLKDNQENFLSNILYTVINLLYKSNLFHDNRVASH